VFESEQFVRVQSIEYGCLGWIGPNILSRFESGAHPREPIIDLLGLTACQTSSLEDHGRQLSKTIGYYTQKISSAKAVGAVVKALSPNVISATSTSSTLRRDTQSTASSQMVSINSDTSFVNVGASNNADLDTVEKKFADLKTSLMEKVQPSSTWLSTFSMSLSMLLVYLRSGSMKLSIELWLHWIGSTKHLNAL